MDLQAIAPILLSWAVHLSGYPTPEEPPAIEFRPHSFFVRNVCGAKECNAVGWYNDRDIIYLDDRYEHDDSSFAHSLLVHEMVHYLQHRSGRFDSLSCNDSLAREREAYYVQNTYIVDAEVSIDRIKPAPTFCRYEAPLAAAVAPE